jgi:endonuclease YncB( thermonuclease family)
MFISTPSIFTESFGHRDGCHRWHSCPSDDGSYVCGDKGYDSECGNNKQEDRSADNDNNKRKSNSERSDNNDNNPHPEGIISNNVGMKTDLSTNGINTASNDDNVCLGMASCFIGTVTKVVDGDTIDVDNTRIRLALANTPEINQPGYTDAKDFVSNTCGVGSKALVDEDDGQKEGSYGRMIGLVYCNDSNISLNQLVIETGHAKILENICKRTEFESQQWAQNNGC